MAVCVVQSSCVSVPEALPSTAVALEGSYVDPQQQEVRFGAWSFDRVPYRAWMDTRPGDVVWRGFGVNFNVDNKSEVEPVARALAEAGVSNARVEVGMGSFSYEDPSRFSNPDQLENLRLRLVALQRNGIRPLILLNANSGGPVPMRGESAELLEDAAAGDTSIVLADASVVRPWYTGLTRQAYQTAYPLITNITAGGRCALSAPLAKPLAKGRVELQTLGVAPFAEGEVLEDGTVDPRARESLRAWMAYVRTVSGIARDCLGTAGAADVGFDMEVWNEYTFGTEFLDGRYFSPRRKYKEKFVYARDGVSVSGHEVLLPMTVDFAADPANGLPGCRVISGFSNQRPWDNGAEMFPGQYAFSRHYYCGISTGDFKPPANQPIIDALGKERALDGAFVPTMRVSMPEYWLTGLKTEMMSRDIQPFPNSFDKHFRFSLNPKGQYAPMWQTEYNLYRGEWSKKLSDDTGVKVSDPRFQNLLEHVAAKSLIRALLMLTHKGNEVVQFYSARSPMHEFGMISEGFFKGGKTFAESGLQLHTCRRTKDFLAATGAIPIPRPLGVGRIVEHTPLLLQKGNGTPAHPDYHARDRLAILPFQAADARYVIALYIVTPDVAHAWQPAADTFDPARYDLPPQTFDITLTNLNGRRAKVRYYDPLADAHIAAAVIAAAPDSITVRLPLTDSPRLLEITERTPGVRILSASHDGDTLSFLLNTKAEVTITSGSFPSREGRHAETHICIGMPAYSVPLQDGEGIRIIARANGLEARYPLWDHDPALARPPLPKGETAQTASAPLRLPPLPPDPRPAEAEGFRHADTLESALPVLAISDTLEATATTHRGHPAWDVTLRLDPTAHPGEAHLHRRLLIIPLKQGFGVSEVTGISITPPITFTP